MAKDRKHNGKSVHYELQEKPTKGNTVLEAADLAFTTVATAASSSPIPLLGEAAGLVLQVIKIIQAIQDNKDQFKQLAAHASELVARAVEACSSFTEEDLPPPLRYDLKRLIHAITPVRDYSLKKLKRGWIKRVVYRRHDVEVIRDYYNEVKNGLEIFNMSSNIQLRQGQAEIIKRLDAQEVRAGSKAHSETSLQLFHSAYPPNPTTNIAPVYTSPPDWPFGPGFPFNQVSSPYQPPTAPPQSMIHNGDAYNSGNVVVTNVVNSNNDFSNNLYHYSQDYVRPRRGPTWKQTL